VTYLSDAQQREANKAREHGDADAGTRARTRSQESKPAHQVWIVTDDDAVKDWATGSRHTLHARVIAATLERTLPYDYVKAVVVVRMVAPAVATTRRVE
jgi:hypothetical protein